MKIKGSMIQLIRGDSGILDIYCTGPNGKPREFVAGETLYFTVKENEDTEEKTLQKVVTEFTKEGHAVIQIQPEDTQGKDYGVYKYDVQLVTQSGWVSTIIPPSLFVLEKEVTYE